MSTLVNLVLISSKSESKASQSNQVGVMQATKGESDAIALAIHSYIGHIVQYFEHNKAENA
jgi:hypothetical protein